jgi:hypothetical protein
MAEESVEGWAERQGCEGWSRPVAVASLPTLHVLTLNPRCRLP